MDVMWRMRFYDGTQNERIGDQRWKYTQLVREHHGCHLMSLLPPHASRPTLKVLRREHGTVTEYS